MCQKYNLGIHVKSFTLMIEATDTCKLSKLHHIEVTIIHTHTKIEQFAFNQSQIQTECNILNK